MQRHTKPTQPKGLYDIVYDMPPHRGYRGRGGRGATFQPKNQRPNSTEMNVRLGLKDRLGQINTYPNRTQTSKRFKVVRNYSSVAEMPHEPEVRETAKNFLKAYYNIFDSEERTEKLGSLYSTEAFFSFSATHPLPSTGRNLLTVPENYRLELLIDDGKKIAQNLVPFPRTEHHINHLSIDIPFYIANPMYVVSMQIIVTGVYKDLTPGQTNPLVAFTRVFVIKQVFVDAEGKPVYHIFNDLFMLQPPTPGQIKDFHNHAQTIAQRGSGIPTNTAEDASRSQETMIKSIMNETKMNRVGSTKLLEESKWVVHEALSLFHRNRESNTIPQDFFI